MMFSSLTLQSIGPVITFCDDARSQFLKEIQPPLLVKDHNEVQGHEFVLRWQGRDVLDLKLMETSRLKANLQRNLPTKMLSVSPNLQSLLSSLGLSCCPPPAPPSNPRNPTTLKSMLLKCIKIGA